MLGRKDYTAEEIEHAKRALDEQVTAYRKLADAVADASDPKVGAALEAVEPLLFNNLIMVLDRYFVHRVRAVAGKDCNPLNEVELIVESLLSGDTLHGNKVIKYGPERSVLKLDVGQRIRVDADRFEALAAAFFDELERKFG
jgi:hypothetical protein